MRRGTGADRGLLAAFLLSGVAALGYELLWTRLLGLALGSETLGMLGTLAGFFGGMALGAYFLDERARRSKDPVRLFAVLEIFAALFALASPYFLSGLARWLPARVGPLAGDNDSLVALALATGIAALTLLPATACMGGTLAALAEGWRRTDDASPDGAGIGRLYAANTVGAALGVLATVHVFLPSLGIVGSCIFLASCGFCAAGISLRWRGRRDIRATPRREPEARAREAPVFLYLLFAGTGMAAIGVESVTVVLLSQALQNTTYTFANIVAVYLIGTSAGAFWYARFADWAAEDATAARVTAALLVAHAGAVIFAASMIALSPRLLSAFASEGASYRAHFGGELLVAGSVFFVPAALMGALFSHLAGLLAPRGVGKAYAANMLGGVLAPFVFGVVGVSYLGYTGGLYGIAVAYVAFFVIQSWHQNVGRWALLAGAAALLPLFALGPRSIVLVPEVPGFEVAARYESLMGLVTVSELEATEGSGAAPVRRLRVGRYFHMGGTDTFGESRMGHLPLLLAPGAKRALFLGVGTGATLGAVRSYPLEAVEAAELMPEILEALPYFEDVNSGVHLDDRVTLHAADARRFVASSRESFDVIVSDLFHPARSGASSLYARQHFEAIRARLTEGGLFAQWLPLYQLDPPSLKVIVRTFLDVFPETHSFLGIYNAQTAAMALIGRVPPQGRPLSLSLERLRETLSEPQYQSALMQDPRDLLASYMMDREALAAYAGDGPLNTDLDARVLLDAARRVYENPSPHATLSDLLPHRTSFPAHLILGKDEATLTAFRDDTRQFSQALTFYLRAELARASSEKGEGAGADEWLALLLRAYEAAPEFVPARALLFDAVAKDPAAGAMALPRMLEADRSLPPARLEQLPGKARV